MSDLVKPADLKNLLGDDGSEDSEIQELLLDVVQTVLEKQVGQEFRKAETVTDEPHDGSGSQQLYLLRPPTSLSAKVKIGQDPTDPDFEIETSHFVIDQNNLRIIHKDGIFPRGLRNIFVSYEAAANLPDLAVRLVTHGTVKLYRMRRAEHVSSRTLGELGSEQYLPRATAALDRDPVWQDGVNVLGGIKVNFA